jgi:uncharacterized protein (TIGR02246 family)
VVTYRPEQAIDLAEIHDLIARIAHAVDEGNIDAYAECFTETAQWRTEASAILELPATVTNGRDAIVAGARQRQRDGIQGPGTQSRHIVSTVSVRFDGPDDARVTAYWQYVTNTIGGPVLSAVGAYENHVQRDDGEWRIALRILRQG